MGRNKQIRKRIEGLRQVIDEHENKIERARSKPYPNEERIALWQHEIAG